MKPWYNYNLTTGLAMAMSSTFSHSTTGFGRMIILVGVNLGLAPSLILNYGWVIAWSHWYLAKPSVQRLDISNSASVLYQLTVHGSLNAELQFAPASLLLPLYLSMFYFLARLLGNTHERVICCTINFRWEAEMVPQLAKGYTRSQPIPSKPWRHTNGQLQSQLKT